MKNYFLFANDIVMNGLMAYAFLSVHCACMKQIELLTADSRSCLDVHLTIDIRVILLPDFSKFAYKNERLGYL